MAAETTTNHPRMQSGTTNATTDSPPPAYTVLSPENEEPAATSSRRQVPPLSTSPYAYPSTPNPHPIPDVQPPPDRHPHFGPTPLSGQYPLLPYAYYDSPTIAEERAKWRFSRSLFACTGMPSLHITHDEDYINKSLLASLDDDADNEPVHDNAVAASYGSSSSGSPSVNYLATAHTAHNQQQIIQQQQRSDSPHHHSDNHNNLGGDHNSIYNPHSFYQNSNSIHSHSEFNSDYDSLKLHQPSSKLIPPTATKHSFNSYPNTTRSRHQANLSTAPTASYRDPQAFYPTSTSDVFPLQMTSPNHTHMQPFDPRASYDYNTGHPVNGSTHKSYLTDQYGAPPTAHPKPPPQQQQPYPSTQPQYTNGIHLSSQTPYGPHVPTSVAGSAPSNTGAPPGLISSNITNGSNATINGEEISTIFVVGFPEDMQEREFQNMFTFSPGFEAATLKIPNKEFTSYGGLIGGTASSAVTPGIGVGVNGLRGGAFHYAGLNDPYNMVTVNQGGVVVDGGRDGGMASWPAAAPLNVNDDPTGSHYLGPGINLGMSGLNAGAPGSGSNLPPRKQIIGFAKFRSREEALAARDVLQGRRVDIEKGAVLKAEMAKKNLHTKRGVGPIPGVGGGGGGMQQGQGQQQQQTSGLDPFDNFREREHPGSSLPSTSLAHLSRLGWRDPVVALNQQQQQQQEASINGLLNGSATRVDEEDRKRDMIAVALAMSLPSNGTPSSTSAAGAIATRGARERAEDDERERRRKEKEMKEKERERELHLMRLRASNSAAYDAFHGVSVGIPLSRQTSSSAGGNVNGTHTESVAGSSPLLAEADTHLNHHQHQYGDEVVGPWDRINSMSATTVVGRPRSTSQCSSSPPPVDVNSLAEYEHEYDEYQLHIQQQVQQQREDSPIGYMSNGNGSVLDSSSGDSGAHGTPIHDGPVPEGGLVLNTSGLRQLERIGQYQHHPQALQHQQQLLHDVAGTGVGNGGSQTSGSGGGNTSPQLPSPTSGGSTTSATSASLRGTVDQNPPINTLYVGNLPTSPPPNGFPQDYLEDTLREIFAGRPGYRKLCFRQKSNGPMCFVEFEDVHHATRAIAELSGNTLRGAVKNGIRLSYSKNPLGVRTPTSAGSSAGGPTLQQQQQLIQTLHNHNHNHQFGSGDGGLGHSRVDDYGATATSSHRVQQQTQPLPRRDTTSSTSSLGQGQLQSFIGGNSNNNSFLSSPPPRFYTTSPGSGMAYGPPTTTAPTSSSTPLSGASSAFIPRANGGMFGQGHGHIGSNGPWLSSPPSFSPFGMALAGESYQSHMIPGDHHQQQQHQHPQSGPAAIDH
ncbi:hypothetical protein BYT27DRAFT_7257679 [Phlegmacium glaucopus]|nr:hypothetical protein BYT27DRAFT_7257679 [Phlegmacium glaucopus]